MRDQDFKPIKAPKRKPKPAPQAREYGASLSASTKAAVCVVRRLLRDMRWDDQGGYAGRNGGKWDFVSTSLGQVTPDELDELFEFAGMTADEIEIVGNCSDCANSNEGYERGYAAPCGSCLRPSHINNFVPIDKLTKPKRSK